VSYVFDSYVDRHPLCKWCPTPGCDCCILVSERVATIESCDWVSVKDQFLLQRLSPEARAKYQTTEEKAAAEKAKRLKVDEQRRKREEALRKTRDQGGIVRRQEDNAFGGENTNRGGNTAAPRNAAANNTGAAQSSKTTEPGRASRHGGGGAGGAASSSNASGSGARPQNNTQNNGNAMEVEETGENGILNQLGQAVSNATGNLLAGFVANPGAGANLTGNPQNKTAQDVQRERDRRYQGYNTGERNTEETRRGRLLAGNLGNADGKKTANANDMFVDDLSGSGSPMEEESELELNNIPNFNSREVKCRGCDLQWCFICNEEAHRGISCYIVKKWMEKNQDEAENVTWIVANTKPCPRCHHPIEKNQGCMHIVRGENCINIEMEVTSNIISD
jgi:hypothetical protein